MKLHSWESRQTMTPQKALEFLKEGNQRFLNNLSINRNLLQLVNDTAEKQFPFAAILSCSDSRVPVELIFDQGLGDIFSIRLAGNIASINAIGSMEYSCKILGSKLIVVLGHTSCGAVMGACDHLEFGNLTPLIDHIKPAVKAEKQTEFNRNSSNQEFVNNVSRLNVLHNINLILEQSEIIRQLLNDNMIGIVGAMYDIKTGTVEFLNANQDKINYEAHAISER